MWSGRDGGEAVNFLVKVEETSAKSGGPSVRVLLQGLAHVLEDGGSDGLERREWFLSDEEGRLVFILGLVRGEGWRWGWGRDADALTEDETLLLLWNPDALSTQMSR